MSKRLWVLPMMVALLVVGVGGLAQAIPSLGGPTGVVATPTAEIAPQDLLSVVLSRQSIKTGSDDLTNWELHALGSVADQAELWLAYSSVKDTFDSKVWGIGGKAQVYRAPESATAIAIGGGWLKWSDGLIPWVEGLPSSGQLKWANSTPADVRPQILGLLGFVVPPSVTVTATPNAVDQDGDQGIALAATLNNRGSAVVDHWDWSVAVPSGGSGSISDTPTGNSATLLINAIQMYQGDPPLVYAVTAEAFDAADALIAAGLVNVVQSYTNTVGDFAAISSSLASAPIVTKSAAANMASVKDTLGGLSRPVGAALDEATVKALGLDNEDVTSWNLYAVASSDLTSVMGGSGEWGAGAKLLGSVGLMYLKADPTLGDSMSLTRPFVSVKFEGAEGTALGLEYRWKDSDLDAKAIFSAVVSHAFTNQIAAELGTTNASPIGLGQDDQDWFVRVGYSFPLGGY